MSKLIELPNGDWIDPQTVTAIRILPEEQNEITGHRCRSRIAIDHDRHGCALCYANDDEHAAQMAGEWAQKINQLRA